MKLNYFLTFICFAIAGLSAFGFFMANAYDPYRVLITIGSGLSLFFTLGGLLALTSPNHGAITNVRVISVVFFIIMLIVHIIFSNIGIRFPPYIIITGILLVLYLLLCYLIIRVSDRI